MGADIIARAMANKALVSGAGGGVSINDSSTTSTLQTWSANQINTQVTSRFKNIGLVTEYGAIGDGVTDDTAAIQACVNACSTVVFPSGYFLTKTIVINSKTRIQGQGSATFINVHPDATGNIFSLTDNAGETTIEKLRIDGTQATKGNVVNGIGDDNPTSTFTKQSVRIKDIHVININGTAFNFSARSMTYIFDGCITWNCTGYGIYLGNGSDSEIRGCHIGGCTKAGISINGSNYRIVGTKVCLCGSGSTEYAGIEVNNANYIALSGCELQQNCYNGILFNNSNGNIISGTLFDSNNKVGLSGVYGQIKFVNSKFNRIDASFIDGRFNTGQTDPFNMASMYGIVVDDKSCYNYFDISYSADGYPTKLPRMTKYYSPVNDISSVFKVNNVDFYGYSSNQIVIGTNAAISGSHSGTINATGVASNNSNEVDFTMSAGASLTNTDWFFQRITLTSAQFSMTGKSMAYVAYQSKVMDGFNITLNIGENSSINTGISEAGLVNITSVNRNTQYMYGAAYKPLSYSNDSGFTVYLDISISCETSKTVNQNDVIAYLKNIKTSFN
jgi:hypothetical protein